MKKASLSIAALLAVVSLQSVEANESSENSKIVLTEDRPRATAIGIPRNMQPNRAMKRNAMVIILLPLLQSF